MKILVISVFLCAVSSLAFAGDNTCKGLYPGKTLKVRNAAPMAFLSGPLQVTILGVDSESGLVSIEFDHNGDREEVTCSELKRETVD